jgi:hypothetical protein
MTPTFQESVHRFVTSWTAVPKRRSVIVNELVGRRLRAEISVKHLRGPIPVGVQEAVVDYFGVYKMGDDILASK